MANKLSVGSREVQTTPSSLMSRMGVVRGQTGDGFQVAADALGKSLDLIALQKAKIAEEKWKSKFSVDTYKTLKKYSQDNPLNLANYMNLAEGYQKESLASVPKRFEGWAEGQIGMQIAEDSSRISASVDHKERVDAVTLMDERQQILEEKMKDEMYDIPVNRLPEYFENSVFKPIADFMESRENLRSGLTANYLTGNMGKSADELAYEMLLKVEIAKELRLVRQLGDLALEAELEDITKRGYKGVNDQYTVNGIVETTRAQLKRVNADYLAGKNRGDIDWTTLTNIRPEDKKMAYETIDKYIDDYLNDRKLGALSALEHQKSQWDINLNKITNGGKGSVNDVSSPLQGDLTSSIFEMIPMDQELSKEDWDKLYEPAFIARAINTIGSQVLASSTITEEGYTIEGKPFNDSVQRIMDQLNNGIGFEDNDTNRKKIESSLQRFVFQEFTRIFTGDMKGTEGEVIYLEDIDFSRKPKPEGGYETNPSIEAVKHLAWKHKQILPQFDSFMKDIGSINLKDPENVLKAFQMAEIYNYVMTRDGVQPDLYPNGTEPILHTALMDLHEDRTNNPLLTQDGQSLIVEKFLSRINPTKTELDDKLTAVEEQWNVYQGKKWVVDRGNKDWFKTALKDYIVLNPEIEKLIKTKYLGVFDFFYQVPGILPDIPFTDMDRFEKRLPYGTSEWSEGQLNLFIDELVAGGIEEDMKYLLANSFDNPVQISNSNSQVYRSVGWKNGNIDLTPRTRGAVSAILRAGGPKGTEFDYRLTNMFKHSITQLDKYLRD